MRMALFRQRDVRYTCFISVLETVMHPVLAAVRRTLRLSGPYTFKFLLALTFSLLPRAAFSHKHRILFFTQAITFLRAVYILDQQHEVSR